jgi:ABC-2 type transport system permease protein
MRAFSTMLRMSFRTYLRNRSALFFGVLFPLILMTLIGLAFGGTDTLLFTISVVDEGNGAVARPLIEGLRRVSVLKIVEEPKDRALARLRRGDRALVVVIPASGGTLEAFVDSSREQTSRTALLILERFVAEANLRIAGSPRLLRVTESAIAGSHVTFFDFLMPGILAMTIAQTGLLSVSTVVAQMRERLLLKRIMATPVSPLAFLGGLVGRFSVTQLFQAAIIFLIATTVFGAHTQGRLLDLVILAVVGAVAFFGMGFAISTVSKTSESANLLGSLVNFPMMFLSGTFWPRELMPQTIRPVIAYLPLSPLVDAMRGVGASGEPLTHYLWAIGYLLAWTVAAFALAVRRFRWE